MLELIDREQAGKNICKYCASNEYCKEDDCMVYRGLRDTPTIQIEAEPARRCHWVLTRDEQYEYCHCSECGYDTEENWMIGSEIPYCSQCGSKNYDGGADNG